jgi:1-acylglycerone phosphate reductase
MPIEDVKQIFETNTFAVLRLCKAVVPIMAKRRSGTIVNIGSIVGEM